MLGHACAWRTQMALAQRVLQAEHKERGQHHPSLLNGAHNKCINKVSNEAMEGGGI